ncbi:Cyclin-dependent kinase catalytic subunit [Binucleata daphniae]
MEESYQRIEKIGEGTYGVVYKAREKISGRIVALKKIRLENENEGIPPTTIREISLLKTIKHPTIIELYDVIYHNNKLFLVFEYVNIDLRMYLDSHYHNERLIPECQIKRMCYQILTAIYTCHSKGVLHRDLKPQNILVDERGNVKLADFGLGRSVSIPLRTYTHDIITLWYRPPEILLGAKYYSSSVDVWSAGCIMAELTMYKPLFPGDSEIDQLYKIFRIKGTPTDDVWPNVCKLPNYQNEFPTWKEIPLDEILPAKEDLIDLIHLCLTYNPLQRISAENALKHPIFYCVDEFDELNTT